MGEQSPHQRELRPTVQKLIPRLPVLPLTPLSNLAFEAAESAQTHSDGWYSSQTPTSSFPSSGVADYSVHQGTLYASQLSLPADIKPPHSHPQDCGPRRSPCLNTCIKAAAEDRDTHDSLTFTGWPPTAAHSTRRRTDLSGKRIT